MAGELIARTAVPDNAWERIAEVEQRANILEETSSEYSVLSDIVPDMGLVESGEFRAGNGVEPGSGFSGIRMGYPSFAYVDGEWNIVGVVNDAMQFGLSAADGKAYFAAGAAVIDQEGITRTGINYFDRWDGEYDDVSRRLEMGVSLIAGSNLPSAYMTFSNPAAATNLQTNGDFEAGALSSWTAADSGAPAWTADSTAAYAGTYAALLSTTEGRDGSQLQTNGDFETGDFTGWTQTGTGTWTISSTDPYAGTYKANCAMTASQTGVLTTNLGGTPRIAVTADTWYSLTAYTNSSGVPSTQYSTYSMAIKWYTATSGGSLISTTTYDLTGLSSSWEYRGMAAQAPATALGAEIVFTMTRTAVAGTIAARWDNVVFKPAQYGTLTTNLGGTPRMSVTALESYRVSCYAKQSNSAASNVWKKQEIRALWYTATSGGSLISTDTVALTLSTSYQSFEGLLTAPATALGAELQIYMVRTSGNETRVAETANAYIDNVVMELVDVSTGIRFRPNVTIVDAPLDYAEISTPSTPDSGYGSTYFDTSGVFHILNDAGTDISVTSGSDLIVNTNTAQFVTGASAALTYVTGSALAMPAGKMQIGTVFEWEMDIAKNNVGTQDWTVAIYIGTNGTTSDTAVVTFTVAGGTAVVDKGTLKIRAICRGPLSASGIIAGSLTLTHNLDATGLTAAGWTESQAVVSGVFDVTTANLIVGLAIDPPGTGSSVFTIETIISKAYNF